MTRKRILTYVGLLGLAFFAAVGMQLVSLTGVITFGTANIQTKTQLIVSAAASLTNALKELAPMYEAERANLTVRYNFASSGALQQQIVNGAPADIFISAAAKQMDALQQKNLLLANTRRILLTNRLVLVVPTQTFGVRTLNNLTDLRIKRIAIGDPRSVPAGEYAQAALTKAGLWNPLKPKFVLANNVRQVLQFVEAGNADVGLVYLTDAKTTSQVKIAQTIPSPLHPPIIYPIAVLKNSRHPNDAKAFAQFLFSDRAQQVFIKYGFKVA
ncbi:MAG: molybdate ABC transporter substrate-binding protein [Aphanocapsa sp. GSE-SYN-MK-11-07L]|jgi:molybdate transport system substrate-binding protein|nr:molybdate ABC transporter substrate-binding protein [Aphanocapsa sp. GSE-SYN-MK-11-07L]